MKTIAAAILLSVLPVMTSGQVRGGPPRTPRQAAPIELTGYWVALIHEDWSFRMVTPPRGEYPNFTATAGPYVTGTLLNDEGKKIADAWDPAKDEAAGLQCKAYGAGNIMRIPGRLHITWANDTTLKIDFDAGMQTRLLRFGRPQPPATPPDWQGFSIGEWEGPPVPGGPGGSLKVVTTRMRPGFLQRNGVPYSGDAVMTEYFDVVKEPDNTQYLVVKTIVEDPKYLRRTLMRSTHFRKQNDASGWNPAPCTAK